MHPFRQPASVSQAPVQVTVTAEPLGDDSLRVSASGEVDLCTAPAFNDALTGVIGCWPGRRVMVSLAGVRFLDASGVRVLIAAHHLVAGAGRDLVVVDAQPIVCQVLRLTGVLGTLAPAGIDAAPATPAGPVRSRP